MQMHKVQNGAEANILEKIIEKSKSTGNSKEQERYSVSVLVVHAN